MSAGGATVRTTVRPGVYYDSVVLLRLQRTLAARADVLGAGVVMATPANREILEQSGLGSAELEGARPDDLVVAVRAASAAAAEAALGEVDALLRGVAPEGDATYRPRGLAAALRQLPEAQWVMVSVPGAYAADLSRDALAAGRNVFLYSDNVALDDEVALKTEAAARGLLVMGPDCGTAILSGVGFGFANRVRCGGIGLVGASGTGLQAVTTTIDALGGGVSHALGTGGRDLAERVGGRTALAAVDLLRRDDATRVVVLVSKPPSPTVAARVLAALRATGKPAVVHFLGHPRPARRIGTLHFATSLVEAAELAVELERTGLAEDAAVPPRAGSLRGLFSGGTLAYEALFALETLLGPIASNLHPAGRPPSAHRVLDLGDDAYTVGRPHPMIDLGALREQIAAAAREPSVAMLLLDVVLGHGAHADPAAELGPEIAAAIAAAAARGGDLEVVVVLVGAADDPQDVARQADSLRAAGAHVVRNVRAAVDRVGRALAPPDEPPARPVPLAALEPRPGVVNAGLVSFHDSLAAQGVATLQMDWRPPAGGDASMAALLRRLRTPAARHLEGS